MRTLSSYFFRDRVTIYALGDGTDADMAPTTNTRGAAVASDRACAIDEVQNGQGTRWQGGPAPTGLAQYEILFLEDPGVTSAEQQIEWTGNQFETFAEPLVLTTTGAARPPRGIGARWTVSAERRV